MAALVDLNIVNNGETAAPFHRLLQEIDIIMTQGRHSIITNYNREAGMDKYLFKTGITSQYVHKQIETLIYTNISKDLHFDIEIQVQFLRGQAEKDILYVNIICTQGPKREELQYVIS